VDALKGIDNVDVGLRIPSSFLPFFRSSVRVSGPSKLPGFYTSLRFFTVCSLDLGACNHGCPSTTLVSAELSDGGASASMLIAPRSFPVITIRPIKTDDSSFRNLGRNAILFVLL
jgi:hypothetical protein